VSRPSSKLNAANTLHNLCAQYVVNLYWEQSYTLIEMFVYKLLLEFHKIWDITIYLHRKCKDHFSKREPDRQCS